jgi:putative transposase
MAESAQTLALMRRIDEQYLRTPFYGSRRLAHHFGVNRKVMQRLMRLMGLEALYPKPRTTQVCPHHRKYPYLLRGVAINRCDQVWSMDITYVPLRRGFLYLTAVLDWHSRYVLSWELSNALESSFCVAALERALAGSRRPEIFNTDQGVQFTSQAFTGRLEERGIAISMAGKGRALDNVFVERLWRSVKYEEIYPKAYENGWEAETSLEKYFRFYNQERLHQSLGYRPPALVYAQKGGAGSRQRA